MSNKTVIVPVSPEGYGCGLLLGLIIRYWYILLAILLFAIGMIFLPMVIRNFSLNSSISGEARIENIGGNTGWTVLYTLHNHSANMTYVGSVEVILPVRFNNCPASNDINTELHGYFPQVVVPTNGDRSVSGSIEITYSELRDGLNQFTVHDLMCWQDEGCGNRFGCQQNEISQPRFIFDEASIPIEWTINVP